VGALQEQLETEWRATQAAAGHASTLTVRRLSRLPAYAFARTSKTFSLILSPLDRVGGFTGSHVLQFDLRRGGVARAQWLTDAADSLRETYSAPAWHS
jgi:hypothetical protein